MPEYDARSAARDRDSGLRKISRLTWRAGAAGAIFSAAIGLALTHHSEAAVSTQPRSTQSPATQQPGSGVSPAPPPTSIQTPAQPPQQSSGGGQVTSGAS